MPSSHLILCRPLLLLSPIPPSTRVFSKKSTLRMRWPKYWSFSFSIIPSKEIPGLISFRMDWLDLQESSPTPQFRSINSLALSFPHSPTLTCIHDHWKNHSLVHYHNIIEEGPGGEDDIMNTGGRRVSLSKEGGILLSLRG